MKIPIRMIGIAITFFWVFLIAFFISAVYSAKDLQFDFGEPQLSVTTDNKVLFSLPITIVNKGYYNIGSFDITTEISDEGGFIIARGSTLISVIKKSEEVTATHNMTIDVNDLLQSDKNYLFNDTEIRIYEMVSMRVAEVIPVQASTNFSMPWGAPLYNFSLGQPQYAEFNLTHFRATVPVSFENHAFFDITGAIQIRMYNDADLLVGEGQTAIDALQHSSYNGSAEFYVLMNQMTDNGHLEVYFITPLFNYGPLVFPYG